MAPTHPPTHPPTQSKLTGSLEGESVTLAERLRQLANTADSTTPLAELEAWIGKLQSQTLLNPSLTSLQTMQA